MTRSETLTALIAAACVLIAVLLGGEALGFSASVIAFVLFVPQALRVWKVRADPAALSGVSLGTQFFLLSNAVLWAFYAVETQAFWVGAPGLVNAPLAICVIILVTRARRASPAPARTPEGVSV